MRTGAESSTGRTLVPTTPKSVPKPRMTESGPRRPAAAQGAPSSAKTIEPRPIARRRSQVRVAIEGSAEAPRQLACDDAQADAPGSNLRIP